MKSITKVICSSILLSTILFGACKKSKNDSSSSMLAGRWKLISTGYDANRNSVMDADETQPIDDTISFYNVFDQDGKGVMLKTKGGTTDTLTWFTWLFANNNTEFTTTRTKGYSSFISLAPTTTTYHIDVFSASDLRLTIGASNDQSWHNYKKQ